ncbi:tetratricopeptide repeat protein [Gordonia sp. LSe1-13]|uniref:Tetratricopeptide repeat protein n=1 Tax=Gordonia sesuvii TaxID=3116777 RepID=A0ABU7MBW7_9ACTN|nr:tetratricopeptide repeat protein [Gordonia sp. LSe1-13]
MAADPTRRDARPIVWMIGFLVVALVVYFVILGQRGIDLITSGTVAGIGVGIGVMILPLIGAWLIFATLRAGIEHQKLARIMADEGRELDVSELPRRASGRIERDAADDLFAQVKQEWEADPTDWHNTYRIARAYDYAGDRTRARQMMKRAVAQYKGDDT